MTPNEKWTWVVLVAQLGVFILQWLVFQRQGDLMAKQLEVIRGAEERAQRHDRLSVRPFLDFDSFGGPSSIRVVLSNHGTGPALNVRLAVKVNGSIVAPHPDIEWPRPLLFALGLTQRDFAPGQEQQGYVTLSGTPLRVGGEIPVLYFQLAPHVNVLLLMRQVEITADYQSLYSTEDETFHAKISWPATQEALREALK